MSTESRFTELRTTGKVGESDLGVGQIGGFVVDILSGGEGNRRFNLEVKKKRSFFVGKKI